jgi:hypothetical protein
MSTILKALDRLEREKREPLARTLQQEVVAPAAAVVMNSSAAMRTPSLLAAVAIGLGIGVGGLGIFLASRTAAPVSAPASPVAAVQALAAPVAVSAAAAPSGATALPDGAWRIDADPGDSADPELLALGEEAEDVEAAIPVELDPEVVVTTTDGMQFVEAELPAIDPAQAARPESEPLAAVAVITPPQQAKRSEAPLAAEVALPAAAKPAAAKTPAVAKPVIAVEPVAKPKPAAESKPLLAREVRETQPRAKTPSRAQVGVLSTVWHPAGERRHAVVRTRAGGTREVREGDLVDGMLVDRIEPSRVVFSDGGMELIRRIGD